MLLFLTSICTQSFVGWASPQTPLGELTALPRAQTPLTVSKGPTSKRSGGKKRGGDGRIRKGEGGRNSSFALGRKKVGAYSLSDRNWSTPLVFDVLGCLVTGPATAGIKITQMSNFAVFRPAGATRFTDLFTPQGEYLARFSEIYVLYALYFSTQRVKIWCTLVHR